MESHNEIEEKYNVGTIDFSEILKEESVVKNLNNRLRLKSLGTCSVDVYSNEGERIPHFHIKNENIDCCVCIFSGNFFQHGIHRDTLNTSQCKELDKWLRNENDKETGTNWQFIVRHWRGNEFSGIDFKTVTQPNYAIMNKFLRGTI